MNRPVLAVFLIALIGLYAFIARPAIAGLPLLVVVGLASFVIGFAMSNIIWAMYAQEVVNVSTVDWPEYQEQVSEVLWRAFESSYCWAENYPELIKLAYTYWARWAEALASQHCSESEWSDEWISPVLNDMKSIFVNSSLDVITTIYNLATQAQTLYDLIKEKNNGNFYTYDNPIVAVLGEKVAGRSIEGGHDVGIYLTENIEKVRIYLVINYSLVEPLDLSLIHI